MTFADLFRSSTDAETALVQSLSVMLPRAFLALLVGGLLAWRPWRGPLGLPPVKRDIAQSQMLLGVAGCVMVCVVGDHVARAFGLVGLGGLIRFRAVLKDPRDGAIFFLVIGLGMAAGIGAYPVVIGGAAFLAVTLAVLEKAWPVQKKGDRLRLHLRLEKPREAERMLRPALAKAEVHVRESSLDELEQTLEFVVEEPGPGAAAAVLAAVPVPVRAVRCELVKEDA